MDAAKLARNKVGVEGAVQLVAWHVFQTHLAAVTTLALLPTQLLVLLQSLERLPAKLTLAHAWFKSIYFRKFRKFRLNFARSFLFHCLKKAKNIKNI